MLANYSTMRSIEDIKTETRPVIFLGSCTSMPNIIESCWSTGQKITGVVDPDYSSQSHLYGLPLLDQALLEDSEVTQNHLFFVATGWTPGSNRVTVRNNKKRQHLLSMMKNYELPGATLVHSTAIVSPLAKLGNNVRIGAMSMVSAGAEIHDHTNIKEQCYVSHGVVIGSDSIVQLKATITGDVHIGSHTYVGISSTIINRSAVGKSARIGNNVLIHPGVLVMQDIPDNAVVSVKDSKFSRVF